MSTSLHHLVFCSQVQIDITEVELLLLAQRAFTYSQLHQVTGVLLYHAGQFVAVFEGERPVVSDLKRRMSLDARHRDIQVLAQGPIGRRSFPDWHMSFCAGDPETIVAPAAGFLDLRDSALLCYLDTDTSPYLLDLLREFVAGVASELA